MRRACLALPALTVLIPFIGRAAVFAQDTAESRVQVLALGNLTSAPRVHPAEGLVAESGLRPLFFEGRPYRGNPTRVFAWYGASGGPEGNDRKRPAMVLVHGGGGTAFKDWVKRWNEHGFAAISIAVEGQTDDRQADARTWKRHAWAGPARGGIYGDSASTLADQWMYHAVADVVLAHSLLRSFPEVDERQVGLMGISWGGVVASTVAGIDTRFAFVIPTYGCGSLDAADNQYGRALKDNLVYREVWEPALRLSRATMPILWLTWLRDAHFPLDAQQTTYRAAAGPRMVAVLPGMGHSHQAGWKPPESYAFATSIVATGKPWAHQTMQDRDDGKIRVEFACTRPVKGAVLVHTTDLGFTGQRRWQTSPAEWETHGTHVRVSAPLPPDTRAYFVNLDADGLTVSSEYTTTAAQGALNHSLHGRPGQLEAGVDHGRFPVSN
jgi:dienelactone hydrolase